MVWCLLKHKDFTFYHTGEEGWPKKFRGISYQWKSIPTDTVMDSTLVLFRLQGLKVFYLFVGRPWHLLPFGLYCFRIRFLCIPSIYLSLFLFLLLHWYLSLLSLLRLLSVILYPEIKEFLSSSNSFLNMFSFMLTPLRLHSLYWRLNNQNSSLVQAIYLLPLHANIFVFLRWKFSNCVHETHTHVLNFKFTLEHIFSPMYVVQKLCSLETV
jgi:hypothetical protein